MALPLHVLIVEDDENDALLLASDALRCLHESGQDPLYLSR